MTMSFMSISKGIVIFQYLLNYLCYFHIHDIKESLGGETDSSHQLLASWIFGFYR
jgi:hypothetical protein